MGTSVFPFDDFSCRAFDLHHRMQRVSHVDLDLLLRQVDWSGDAGCSGKVRRSASKQRRLFKYMATGDPWDSHYPASIQDILDGYGEEDEKVLPAVRKPKKKKRRKKKKKKKTTGRPKITYHEAEVVKLKVTESPKRPGWC